MLLVYTADERFWRTDQQVLFLGEWCRLYSRRHVWERLSAEVLPYHWDSLEKCARDFDLAEQLAARAIDALSVQLNTLHGVRFPRRSWDIACGNFISELAGVVLDRFRSIEGAAMHGGVRDTLIESPTRVRTPDTIGAARHLLSSEPFSRHIYTSLIRLVGLPHTEISIQEAATSAETVQASTNRSQRARRAVTNSLAMLGRHLPARLTDIALVDSYFGNRELLTVSAALAVLPLVRDGAWDRPPASVDVNPRMREGLAIDIGDDVVSRVFSSYVVDCLPLTMVEAFSTMLQRVSRVFPRRSTVLMTANAHVQSDAFKIWAASRVSRSARLLIHQHGGLYGHAHVSAAEHYERRTADQYITWGWNDDWLGDGSVVPMAATKLATVGARIVPKPDGEILMGCNSNPLQFYRFASMPVGGQTLVAHAEHVTFLRCLTPMAQARILIRLFPHEYGWQERQRFIDEIPGVRLADTRESFYAQLCRSRLFVCNNNQTTHLETLAANFPTVMFWNPELWPVRPEAQSGLDDLKRVGVFHDDPISAAAFVSEISDDPAAWWEQSDVQDARRTFCQRFARVSRTWRNDWTRLLTRGRSADSGTSL